MSVRAPLFAIVAACLLARGALAQAPAAASDPVGTWRGTSLCLVRPSACNDEVVVYRITRPSTADTDSLSIDARKIASGREQAMGVLGCRLTAPSARVTCSMPNGQWRFTIRGDSLVGELRLPDDTKFRDVRTARAPAGPHR